MSYAKQIVIVLIINLSLTFCKITRNRARNEDINTRMYERDRNYDIMNPNLGLDLWYPRGDKDKLSALSNMWKHYYDCSRRSLKKLTQNGQVPATMVMAYVGAVARLPCSVCAPPDKRNCLVWMYAELPPVNEDLKPLRHNERMVLDHNNLHIYNVQVTDAGMYKCMIGDSNSLVVLEVVDVEEKYTLVKPSTSRGPYEAPPYKLTNSLTILTSWSPWSECSACGKVGRRRRYGLCYLRLNPTISKETIQNRKQDNNITLNNHTIELFQTFPGGVPCRSRFLPSTLTQSPPVRGRRSEIMIGLCKVPCEAVIFKVRSCKGEIIETVNNTAGIYSLQQVLPNQPPLPSRDIIFTYFGHHITIRCPGTTLSDVPITWRCGTKLMAPRDVDKTTGGRMYINSRDHLVIDKILYRDANLYSCWQRDKLAGAVQLVARYGYARATSRYVLLALVALSAALLVLTHRMWRSLRRPFTAYYAT